MRKSKLAIYPLFLLFAFSCKKESAFPEIESKNTKSEILGFLSKNLPEGYFEEIDLENIQLTSPNEANNSKAMAYFKPTSSHKSEIIILSLKNATITGDLINLQLNKRSTITTYSGKIVRTNLNTKETKTIIINENITSQNSLSETLSSSSDPIQLSEIIVVGRINGQSSFIISAFMRGLDANNFIGIYFNSQTQSVVPPGDYEGWGIYGSPEIVELQFESAEEATAFQQWLTQITPAELALCLENPVAALQIFRYSRTALSAFPHWNGLGDAKRHAYWMALCAKDPLVGPLFATRFGIAHETGAIPSTLLGKPFGQQQWQLEIQSDHYNNAAGIGIINLMIAAGLALTEDNIKNWINNYATPGGAFTYLCDPTPTDPGSGDEVLRYSNQSCP